MNTKSRKSRHSRLVVTLLIYSGKRFLIEQTKLLRTTVEIKTKLIELLKFLPTKKMLNKFKHLQYLNKKLCTTPDPIEIIKNQKLCFIDLLFRNMNYSVVITPCDDIIYLFCHILW